MSKVVTVTAPLTSSSAAGFVVPIPTKPAALIVMPEEVALKAPAGVILNLFPSELSKPRSHASVPASWNCIMGSPAEVWLIVSVVVAVRVVAVRPRNVGEEVVNTF